MPEGLKGFLIVIVCIGLGALEGFLLFRVTRSGAWIGALIGAIFGFLYGVEAGVLLIYNLNSPLGWLLMIVDMTWSLPNTAFGYVVGNIIYICLGTPSQAESKDSGCIVFKPRDATAKFGNKIKQTLGTLIFGRKTDHEAIHLLQARVFGPLFLPIFAANYVVNFVIQSLFTFTIGGVLWLAKVRETPCFRPPAPSSFGNFFGWIYRANLFEIWAYGVASS